MPNVKTVPLYVEMPDGSFVRRRLPSEMPSSAVSAETGERIFDVRDEETGELVDAMGAGELRRLIVSKVR